MHPAVTLTTLLLVVACGVGAISDSKKRYPRDENTYLEYEISMYFDKALYDKWYNHMTPNSKSPETRKKLTIALLKKYYVSLIYANEPSFIGDNMNGKALNVSSALFAFRQWLKKTKKTFDHFQLHTGHKFSDGPFSNAFLSTCNDQSVSIISDNNVKDFWMIVKQAVEALGHSFNMKHLGKKPWKWSVMNPNGGMAWAFTESSKEILNKTLSRLDAEKNKCLHNRDHQMKDALPQARLSANEQCRLAFGICSEVCQHDLSKICTGMECCTGHKFDGVVIPLAGTVCGSPHSRKICHGDYCATSRSHMPKTSPDIQDPQCLAKKAPLEYEISMYFDKALYDIWYKEMTPTYAIPEARKKMTIALLKKYFVSLIFANEPPFISDNVHKSTLNYASALQDFTQWLKERNQTFDHFQLHTGYKFFGGKLSFAYPSICNSQAVSIVSGARNGDFPRVAHSALKSIGHRHRYVWNSLSMSSLDTRLRRVMNPRKRGWGFAAPSIKILRSTISRLDREGNDCLRTRDHQMKDALPKRRLSANEQCRLIYGVYARVCECDHQRFMCRRTKCCIASKLVGYMMPLPGTACGFLRNRIDHGMNSITKMCHWEACFNHKDAPAKIPGCPYGDEIAGCQAPRDCYASKKLVCCETCANLGNKG